MYLPIYTPPPDKVYQTAFRMTHIAVIVSECSTCKQYETKQNAHSCPTDQMHLISVSRI